MPCLALAFGPSPGFASGPEVPPELRTRAEASDFRATSTYAETLDFLRRLEARSPHFRLDVFGTSEQGRPMPFVVVSKDQAFTPEAVRRLSKPIVMLQGGIHAGEIDGKDALLLLLRDLALGLHPAVLDRVTLLVVPIYNVDGHERVSRFNRSNQDGPEEGMGFRTNARGLYLNRDHLKLDSAEARALIGLFNAWRPHLHVDNHVSDGFDHAWVVGYATAEAPQAAPSIDAWARATLPKVAEATRGAGYPTGPYLELLSSEEPLKGAITPPYRPRYSTGYFALRNRPSILIETHSRKPFRTRVLGYAFTRSTSLVTGTPLATYQRGQLLESDLPWFHTPRVAQSVPRPRGYLVLPGWPQIERVLRAHGLRVEPLTSNLDRSASTRRPERPAAGSGLGGRSP